MLLPFELGIGNNLEDDYSNFKLFFPQVYDTSWLQL